MNAYPLEAQLSSLPRNQRVYVVRNGLVYLYPACILRDVANDRYTMHASRPWEASGREWDHGRRLSDRLTDEMDLWDHARLKEMARTLWVTAGAQSTGFEVWWSSVNVDAPPDWIGAAAMVAARELMHFPLFRHRYLVDTMQTVA